MEGLGSTSPNGLFYGSWDWSSTSHQGPTSVGISHWDTAKGEPVSDGSVKIQLAS
jgi:hypothetical protein